MSNEWMMYACLGAGLASALVAGVFQAFSDFVMKALAAAPGGAEAMQEINRKVFRSVFLITLLGLFPVLSAFAGLSYLMIEGPALMFVMSGAAIYAIFVFAVTMFGNVPMNNRLDCLDPKGPEIAGYWTVYATGWTNWNHLRTLGSAATAACFLLAAVSLA